MLLHIPAALTRTLGGVMPARTISITCGTPLEQQCQHQHQQQNTAAQQQGGATHAPSQHYAHYSLHLAHSRTLPSNK
jgi:hypothetical protein